MATLIKVEPTCDKIDRNRMRRNKCLADIFGTKNVIVFFVISYPSKCIIGAFKSLLLSFLRLCASQSSRTAPFPQIQNRARNLFFGLICVGTGDLS